MSEEGLFKKRIDKMNFTFASDRAKAEEMLFQLRKDFLLVLQNYDCTTEGIEGALEVCIQKWFGKGKIEKFSKQPHLLDIADMPDCSLKVKDGLHSVSEGKIFWTENNKVTCREHGACNCVNKERTIWRCLTCHEGAYVPKIEV